MNLSEREQPTNRFTGLAEIYARFRPDYPGAALDLIASHCGLGKGAVIVDVGCGTGICTRLFAQRGFRVIGIEPNDDMRHQAEARPCADVPYPPEYWRSKAEHTGLPDVCADAVLAAQAFHWFEAKTTLREFHRVLKPAGWAVLMWNERDPHDAFTAAYGKIVAREAHGKALEAQRHRAGEALLNSPLFGKAERQSFTHDQMLDEEGLLGRAFSASYAPKEESCAKVFAEELSSLFGRHQRQGHVRLRYETSVYLAQKRD
jgi:ubiquinone/menaquinone biosynthesis C-methylase UbiE